MEREETRVTDIPEYEEAVLDDGKLTLDRMVRSLFRNKDGLLCVNEKNHKSSIDERHNAICLYVYFESEGMFMIDVHYVYVMDKPDSYEEWRDIAFSATRDLIRTPPEGFHGVYGWSTTVIRVSVVRTGDMLIKVDAEGSTGVRVTFNRSKKRRASYRGKKA